MFFISRFGTWNNSMWIQWVNYSHILKVTTRPAGLTDLVTGSSGWVGGGRNMKPINQPSFYDLFFTGPGGRHGSSSPLNPLLLTFTWRWPLQKGLPLYRLTKRPEEQRLLIAEIQVFWAILKSVDLISDNIDRVRLNTCAYYRPQTKFLVACVKNSVHRGGGVCLSACWDTTPPRSRPPAGPGTPRCRHPHSRHTPLHSACWEIWSTSGRYASWNAILLWITLRIDASFTLLDILVLFYKNAFQKDAYQPLVDCMP